MGLETGTFINDLVVTNPLGTDDRSTADDHLRLIKDLIRNTIVNGTAAINPTPAEFNTLVGILATTAELNKLNGVTATTAELNRLTSIAGAGALDAFPTGTLMTFQQTAAPTGWTKQTTHNNKAFRVVSGAAGSAGATAFTTLFGASKVSGAHTLVTSEIPAHDHVFFWNFSSGGAPTNYPVMASSGATTNINHADPIGNRGGGGSHTHTLSLDLQYVDLIIASKV